MRIPAPSVTVAMVAATVAGGAAPASAWRPVPASTHNSATATYERVDGAVN